MTILKYFLLLLFLAFGLPTSFAQADSLKTNPTGLRYDITERPWAIMLDLTRLSYKARSIQLSTSYRPNFRFGFESEVNYYLPTQLKSISEGVNQLNVQLSNQKPNLYLSGIAKVYFGKKKINYLGARMAFGSTHFDLSKKVCTQAEPTTSGELCRCLKTEERTLTVQKNQFLYTARTGINLPIHQKIRLDLFFDFTGFLYSPISYNALDHACKNTWSNFESTPKTDGLFNELTHEINHFFFSFGLKLGYAL